MWHSSQLPFNLFWDSSLCSSCPPGRWWLKHCWLLFIFTCEKWHFKAKWFLHVGGQGSKKSKCTSKVSVSFQIRVLNDDGANTEFWLFKLGLCARGAGNSAVVYSKPMGVIHTSQEAGEGIIVPQDTKPSRTFPAVGNVQHPQIRSTDVSQSRGCRKTEGEKV